VNNENAFGQSLIVWLFDLTCNWKNQNLRYEYKYTDRKKWEMQL